VKQSWRQSFWTSLWSLCSKWPPLASAQALKDVPAHRAKETVDLLLSCQHSGRLTVRIWIWLIIKYGRYFRSKCIMWRSTMLMSCASASRLYGMNLTSVLLTRQSSSGAPNASSYKSLRWGQRWPLWAQTLKTSSEWSSPWMSHIL